MLYKVKEKNQEKMVIQAKYPIPFVLETQALSFLSCFIDFYMHLRIFIANWEARWEQIYRARVVVVTVREERFLDSVIAIDRKAYRRNLREAQRGRIKRKSRKK